MTADLIAGDVFAGALATAAWLVAARCHATGHRRAAGGACTVAVAALAAQAGLILALSRAGWWFVQEKVTLTLPLAVVAAGAVLALAASEAGRRPGNALLTTALCVAGYASATGPVLALLVGYSAVPWAVGLVTVALVGLAGILTWRGLGRAADGDAPVRTAPIVDEPIEREPALSAEPARVASMVGSGRVGAIVAVSALGVAAALLAAGTPSSNVDPGGGAGPRHAVGHGIPVTTLRGPDVAAAEAAGTPVRRFTLTAQTATVKLSSGWPVAAWTFDGQVPGPPLRVTQGELVEVTLRNADIAEGVTLHWHGYDVPNAEDGVPGLTQDGVLPGQEHVYRFVARQAGTYWYHTHEASDPAVRRGLYGTLVVDPKQATVDGVDLTLALHTLADVFVIGDRDEVTTQEVVPGAPVRLRLINTDSGPHRLAVAGGRFRLAAVDGRDVHEPGEVAETAVRIPAGGRADLTLVMPDTPVAVVVDGNLVGAGVRLVPPGQAPSTVVDATSHWPELDLTSYGTPADTPFGAESSYDRQFTMVLDRSVSLDGSPRYAHTVNGRAYPGTPTQLVSEGDLVRMTVVNRGRDTHPMHLHGHTVLALSRNGKLFNGSPIWLDTFDVQPGEVWQVAFRAINPGVWMNHCHNLSHAELGMAVHLSYDGYRTPYGGAHHGA